MQSHKRKLEEDNISEVPATTKEKKSKCVSESNIKHTSPDSVITKITHIKASSNSLPDKIEVKNQVIEGDATFSANQTTTLENITSTGKIWSTVGVPKENVSEVKECIEIFRPFLQKKVFPLFGLSVQLDFQIGKSTTLKTFTPGKDGMIVDPINSIITKEAFDEWSTTSPESFREDIQNAMQDPEKHLQLLSFKKTR